MQLRCTLRPVCCLPSCSACVRSALPSVKQTHRPTALHKSTVWQITSRGEKFKPWCNLVATFSVSTLHCCWLEEIQAGHKWCLRGVISVVFLGALEDEDDWKMSLSLWFYLGGAPGPPYAVRWPPSTVNKQAPIQITLNTVSWVWQLGTIIQFLHTFCDLTLSHNLTELLIQFMQLSAAAKKTSAGYTGPLALDTAGVLPSFESK